MWEEIAELGVRITGVPGKRRLVFPAPVERETIQALLPILRRREAALSLYDPLFPSPSDPGAYFDYAQQGAAPGSWSMTLGNHGWSGGIYQITEEALAAQIFSLLRRGELAELRFEDGRLFTHRSRQPAAQSADMDRRLRRLHEDADSSAARFA